MERILSFLKAFLIITSASSVIGLVLWVFVWNYKAEAEVKKCVLQGILPLSSRVSALEKRNEELSEWMKKIDYRTKETAYLIRSMAGPAAVKKMKKEIEVFKPEQ